jgi:transcriptional regulator with XRE-family HTH domain
MGQREQASSPINLDALRLIREGFADSGMTQEGLAQASDIPRSTLGNILSPTAAPRLIHVGQLVKIALAFGVDPRDWVGELETLERARRGEGDEIGRRRKSVAPRVQQRAARKRSGRTTLAEE